MLTPSCSAFRFDDNSCQLYDATYLYKDKTDDGMEVYMHDTLWNQRGNARIFVHHAMTILLSLFIPALFLNITIFFSCNDVDIMECLVNM